MAAPTESCSRRWLFAASAGIAALYSVFFALIGWTSPTAVEILRDFDDSLTWRTPFLSIFHLTWTVPAGVLIAFLLLRKDRHFAHQTSKRVNIASVITLGAFTFVWLYAVFSRLFPLLEASPISGPRP